MFIQNKYTNWYFRIIDNAKNRKYTQDVNRHHIIPRSCGGSNDDSNLVNLTRREHFVCHLLLVKMLDGAFKEKMVYALWYMTKLAPDRVTSRTYDKIRENACLLISKNLTGRKLSEETIAKRILTITGVKKPKTSAALKGRKNPGVSAALRGRKQPQDVIDKRAASLRGKPSGAAGRKQSIEEKELRSKIMKGRPSPRKGQPWSESRRKAFEDSKKDNQ